MEIFTLSPGPERTVQIVAWIQSIQPGLVLVGGAAVEVYSGGAYTTGDRLDALQAADLLDSFRELTSLPLERALAMLEST